MKNFGYVNNMGEVKQIQLNTYTGEGHYVGITRNGFAYVYENELLRKLSKVEIGSYLGLTSAEVMQLLRARGKIEFGSSKGSDVDGASVPTDVIKKKSLLSKVLSKDVEKPLLDEAVVDTGMDNRKVREKSGKARSVSKQDKVNAKKEIKQKKAEVLSDEVSSLEESNKPKRSMKTRLKEIEKNYVTKEQLIAVVKSITGGE